MASTQKTELLPAWLPSNEGQGVVEFALLPDRICQVEKLQDKPSDTPARLKATAWGRFYTHYLKRYALVRGSISWLWRRLYPIYVNHIAIHLRNRTLMKWRALIKLSEFVKKNDISVTKLADGAKVETPPPKVYPVSYQSCLLSPYDHYHFPEVFVAQVSSGLIYGGTNLILANGGVICHDLYDFERDYTSEELQGRNLIDPKRCRIRWLLHDDTPECLPVAATFVDACALNYAHWLTEVLPRIAAFCAQEQFKDIPIVVNNGLHKNIMQSLFLVAGPERKILTLAIGRAIHVEELYLTSVAGYVPFGRRNNKLTHHSHGLFNPRAFELICNQIVSFAEKLPEQAWPEKIYLRRNSGTRKVANSTVLEELLVAHGYIIVEPEKLSFLEQVQLVRNSKKIISPTGAALANAIFCKPGACVGVLMAKHENMIYRYWSNMLAPLGINVSSLLGDIIDNHAHGIHADFDIAEDNIFELLKSWETK